jgi:hypothetical protein
MARREYTTRELIDCYKFLRQDPLEHAVAVDTWTSRLMYWAEWRHWFRKCLDRKITTRGGDTVRGRKDTEEYQRTLYMDSLLVGVRSIPGLCVYRENLGNPDVRRIVGPRLPSYRDQ